MKLLFNTNKFLNELGESDITLLAHCMVIQETAMKHKNTKNPHLRSDKQFTNTQMINDIKKKFAKYDGNYDIYDELMPLKTGELSTLFKGLTFFLELIYDAKTNAEKYEGKPKDIEKLFFQSHSSFENKFIDNLSFYDYIDEQMKSPLTYDTDILRLSKKVINTEKPLLYSLILQTKLYKLEEFLEVSYKDGENRLFDNARTESPTYNILEHSISNQLITEKVQLSCSQLFDILYHANLQQDHQVFLRKLEQSEKEVDKKDKALDKQVTLNASLKQEIQELNNEIKCCKREQELLKKETTSELKISATEKEYLITLHEEKVRDLTQNAGNLKVKLQKVTAQHEKETQELLKDYNALKDTCKVLESELTQTVTERTFFEKKTNELQVPSASNVSFSSFKKLATHYFTDLPEEFLTFIHSLNLPNLQTVNQVPFVDKEKEKCKQREIKSYIGYVTIEGKEHYVNFADGTKHVIPHVTPRTVLAKHQFIEVSKTYNILKFSSCVYSESSYPIRSGSEFSKLSIEEDKDKVYCKDNYGDVYELSNTPNFRLPDCTIVLKTPNNEIVTYYSAKAQTLTDLEDSIRAKGLTPYIVMKELKNGLVLLNAITQEEIFKEIYLGKVEVRKYSTILLDKKFNAIRTYISPNLYKKSDYYDKKETVVISEIEGGLILFATAREKLVFLQNVPNYLTFKVGDAIVIDEENNFLFKKKEEVVTKTVEQKKAKFKESVVKEVKAVEGKAKVPFVGNILILGKPNLEGSYEETFNAAGYGVTFVDGYAPNFKVNRYLDDVDFVIVSTQYISHSHMWHIKDSAPIEKVMYAKKEGANAMLVQFEDHLLKFNKAISETGPQN